MRLLIAFLLVVSIWAMRRTQNSQGDRPGRTEEMKDQEDAETDEDTDPYTKMRGRAKARRASYLTALEKYASFVLEGSSQHTDPYRFLRIRIDFYGSVLIFDGVWLEGSSSTPYNKKGQAPPDTVYGPYCPKPSPTRPPPSSTRTQGQ